MQESHLHLQVFLRFCCDQALCLHRPGFGACLRLTVRLRTERAKIPALLVLHCRRSIGVKDVPFVEHGVSDLFYETQVHMDNFGLRTSDWRFVHRVEGSILNPVSPASRIRHPRLEGFPTLAPRWEFLDPFCTGTASRKRLDANKARRCLDNRDPSSLSRRALAVDTSLPCPRESAQPANPRRGFVENRPAEHQV